MNPAVFIDANVPIYAAGREHRYKQPCARILRILADDPKSFVTDSEVLQEIMHRYLASGRWTLGREVVRAFAEVMRGRIEPVHAEDVTLAAELADRHLNQYQGGMCISGRLTMTERTPRHFISPLDPNWVGTDSAV